MEKEGDWIPCSLTIKEFDSKGLCSPGVFFKADAYNEYREEEGDPDRMEIGPYLIGDISEHLAYGYDGYLGEWDDEFRITAYIDCRELLGLTGKEGKSVAV
jgi:hypothetical protein